MPIRRLVSTPGPMAGSLHRTPRFQIPIDDMARASSSTVCFDVSSRTTGATLVVVERTWYRARIVNGRLVRSPLLIELKDTAGRIYERMNPRVIRCVASGEEMIVHGIAPSIRPTQKAAPVRNFGVGSR